MRNVRPLTLTAVVLLLAALVTGVTAPPATAQSGPDPTRLPPATTTQVPLTDAYNALGVPGLAAGQSYQDPTTGVTIHKLTSATFPTSAPSWGHDYAEGGNEISLPYRADGVTRAVLVYAWSETGHWLVDFTPGVGLSNPRQLTGALEPASDLHFTFSSNPATPYYAYIGDGTGIRRFDIRTMTEAPGDGWPVPDETGVAFWLHQSENDGLFVWMRGPSGDAGLVAYEPSTGRKIVYTDANVDEPRIDRAGRYIGLSLSSPSNGLSIWDFTTDTVTLWSNAGDPGLPFAHVASLRDRWMACNWNLGAPEQYGYFDPTTFDSSTFIPGASSGCGHMNGNWIQHPESGSLDDQWAASLWYGSLAPPLDEGFIAPGGILLVTPSGQKRLLAHPYNTTSEYSFLSFAKFSPDGRYLMFTSDMNGSGRSDVFLAELPAAAPQETGKLLITRPQDGDTVKEIVTVRVEVKSPDIAVVELFADGAPVGGVQRDAPYQFRIDTRFHPNGPHGLVAVGRDEHGATVATDAITIIVANPLPVATLQHPKAGGVVSAEKQVSATVTHRHQVANVQFRVDGAPLGGPQLWPPYDVTWNTMTVPDGPHTLTAVVTTLAGTTTESEAVEVMVVNTPTVTIRRPQAGEDVRGQRTVRAAVTNLHNVQSVQFHLDGAPLGAPDTKARFHVVWNTLLSLNGPHTLRAEVTTLDGTSVFSDPVGVNVANPVPSVTIKNPKNGATVSGEKKVQAAVTHGNAVASVQFHLDGVPLGALETGAPYDTLWSTLASGDGPHTLIAELTTLAGATVFSEPVTVNVENTPTITLKTPTPGATVSGQKTIAAAVTHAENVASVQFHLDGMPLGAPQTRAPYDTPWNTLLSLNGPHTLRAALTTRGGDTIYSEEITVTVSNPTPSGTINGPRDGATVKGRIQVTASITQRQNVRSVQFKLDGADLGPALTSPDWQIAWDTASAAVGTHTLSAVITTPAGQEITVPAVRVTVIR